MLCHVQQQWQLGVAGNGDILTHYDARRRLDESGGDAVMGLYDQLFVAYNDALDSFEFFVGIYSFCALPRGDFLLKFLWDLYDPALRGWMRDEEYRVMLREVMCADLPDDLKQLCICDTGCGTSMPNRPGQCRRGSIYKSESHIEGAGGKCVELSKTTQEPVEA